MEENEFRFNYKAPTEEERREIEDIRRQYLENEKKEETKIERLKRLNNYVNNFSTIISLIIGIVSVLIFGTGLSMILLNWTIPFGAIVCAIGLIVGIFAYPVYVKTLNYNKKKYREEIIRLSEELLNEQNTAE